MWLRRADYQRLLNILDAERMDRVRWITDNGKLHQHIEALERQNGVLTTHGDWLRTRVNALEKERQALLAATGIQVAVPQLMEEPRREADPSDGLTAFDDMGDDEALKAGIPVTDPLEHP